MGRDDWFRRTTWTAQDREEFWHRLNRSRTDRNKAQYLRIQAHQLQHTGSRELLAPALDLLDYMLTRYPEESEVSCAHLQQAECLAALGRDAEAVSAFRASMDDMRATHGVITYVTDSPVAFGKFVISRGMTALYDEAIEVLDEFNTPIASPFGEFHVNAIRAIVAHHHGRTDEAGTLARKALAAAETGHALLRSYPDAGLMDTPDSGLVRKLQRVAGEPEARRWWQYRRGPDSRN